MVLSEKDASRIKNSEKAKLDGGGICRRITSLGGGDAEECEERGWKREKERRGEERRQGAFREGGTAAKQQNSNSNNDNRPERAGNY